MIWFSYYFHFSLNQINLNSINDRLKFIRKSKGLSQQEMADFIDVSLMSYRRYERSGKSIPHTKLETITKKTDISLEFLINGKDLLKNYLILKIQLLQNF